MKLKKYSIWLYKKNKLKKIVDIYDTYEHIREALINKVIVFENKEGFYLNVIYLKDYDEARVMEWE